MARDPWSDYFGAGNQMPPQEPASSTLVIDPGGPVFQETVGLQDFLNPPTPASPTGPVAPTQPQATRGLEGFDWAKLGTGATSPKYAFAQFAGGQPTTLQALQSFWPQLQAAYSQYFKPWRLQGDRLVYDPSGGALNPAFGGVTSFDVLRGATQGGLGWQWLPQTPGVAGPPSGGGGEQAGWPEWLRSLFGSQDLVRQNPAVQQAVNERAWDALRQLLAGMSAAPPPGTVPPVPTPPAVQPPRGEGDRRQESAAPASALAALAAAMSAPQARAPAAPAPAPSIAPSAITVPAPEVPWMEAPSAPVGASATAGGAPGMGNWALPAGQQPPMPLPVFYGLPWALQQALIAALTGRA